MMMTDHNDNVTGITLHDPVAMDLGFDDNHHLRMGGSFGDLAGTLLSDLEADTGAFKPPLFDDCRINHQLSIGSLFDKAWSDWPTELPHIDRHEGGLRARSSVDLLPELLFGDSEMAGDGLAAVAAKQCPNQESVYMEAKRARIAAMREGHTRTRGGQREYQPHQLLQNGASTSTSATAPTTVASTTATAAATAPRTMTAWAGTSAALPPLAPFHEGRVDTAANPDGSLTITAGFPGVAPEDLNIAVRGNQLMISVSQSSQSRAASTDSTTPTAAARGGGMSPRWRARAATRQTFTRSVTLPTGSDPAAIVAKLENGAAVITVPKARAYTSSL